MHEKTKIIILWVVNFDVFHDATNARIFREKVNRSLETKHTTLLPLLAI